MKKKNIFLHFRLMFANGWPWWPAVPVVEARVHVRQEGIQPTSHQVAGWGISHYIVLRGGKFGTPWLFFGTLWAPWWYLVGSEPIFIP